MRGGKRLSKAEYYGAVRQVPYDLVKEVVAALLGVALLVVVLSVALSSPDVPSDTIERWAQDDPVDFLTTASAELGGSSTSAGYGAPYNDQSGAVQSWGFLKPQSWLGIHQPVAPTSEFVLQPLQLAGTADSKLAAEITTFTNAGSDQQTAWIDAYTKALGNATVAVTGVVTVPAGDDGPIPDLMNRLLVLARGGGLDGLLLVSDHFYQTNYTKPLLFMGDGGHLAGLAEAQNLLGSQWGVMNETGRYPGQAWLWVYTMWYQVAPYDRTPDNGFLGISSANADLAAVGTTGLLTALLLLLPFIPGLRDIPRWIPVHKLVWRRYYQALRSQRSR